MLSYCCWQLGKFLLHDKTVSLVSSRASSFSISDRKEITPGVKRHFDTQPCPTSSKLAGRDTVM